MIDLLYLIQDISRYFPKFWLIVAGIVIFLLGLYYWLMGSRQVRFCAILASLALSFSISKVIWADSINMTMIVPIVVAVLAFLFPKKILTLILATAIAGSFALVISGSYSEPLQSTTEIPAPENSATYTLNQAGNAVDYANTTIVLDIKQWFLSMKSQFLIEAGLVFIVALVAGILLPKFTSCLCISAIGIFMISCGLAIALFAKPASPVNIFNENLAFFGLVFGGMLIVGTIAQLVLASDRPQSVREQDDEEVNGE